MKTSFACTGKHAVIPYLMKNKIYVWTDVAYLDTFYGLASPWNWELFCGTSKAVDGFRLDERMKFFQHVSRGNENNPHDKALLLVKNV